MRKLGLVIGGIGLIALLAACGPMDDMEDEQDSDRAASGVRGIPRCQTTVMPGTCSDSLTASKSYTISSGWSTIRLIMQRKPSGRLSGPQLQILTSARRPVPATIVSDVGVVNLSAWLDRGQTYTLVASSRVSGDYYLDVKY